MSLPSSAFGFRIDGFSTPESFIIDSSTGMYYVSNIAGSPAKKDNNGFISRIDSSGNLADRHFIQGGENGVTLHAPKGLLIIRNELYVTDIDTLRRFDKTTGKPLRSVGLNLLGAQFRNDLTTDLGDNIYISDSSRNAIYKINTKESLMPSLVIKDPALGTPNGLVYDARHKRLVVACGESGKILAVDLRNKNFYPLISKKFKELDGIDFDHKGNLLVADHKAGTVYRVRGYSKIKVLRENMITPANTSFDPRNKQVLIPTLKGNIIFTLPLN